jgi:hypothetical protein
MYFTFAGSGDCYLDEIAILVDQWTYYRGSCLRPYKPGDHEFARAKKMAVNVVTTYRDHYRKKHGGPPNPLGLEHTLDRNKQRSDGI